jgi:CBS domain containing-hemolysin-like protein
MIDTFGIFSILLLVAANAYFVAAEYALVTVRWTRIEELAERGVYGAAAVRYAIEHRDIIIAAAQLGVTLTSLGLGWIGEPAMAHQLQPLINRMGIPWSAAVAHGIAIGVAFLLSRICTWCSASWRPRRWRSSARRTSRCCSCRRCWRSRN